MRRKGFSLVELLAALLIICTLLAIILPAYGKARAFSKRIECASSMHQLGIAVSSYTIASFNQLPTHYGNANVPFDQFWMYNPDSDQVNLGLVLNYLNSSERVFYCPTQTDSTSPALAMNSKANPWNNGKGKGKGNGNNGNGNGNNENENENGNSGSGNSNNGNGNGNGGGNGKGNSASSSSAAIGSTVPTTPAVATVLNSSFDARPMDAPSGQQPSWTVHNYENKVIYTDFVGVDGWVGRDRFAGTVIRAAHDGRGVNRLFGDGSALWAEASRLLQQRQVNAIEPTPQEMSAYYKLLDVVP